MGETKFRCPHCGGQTVGDPEAGSPDLVCTECGRRILVDNTVNDGPETMQLSSDPLVGTRFSGLRVIEKIGEGGLGTVYRCHDENLDQDVAVKVLKREFASDPEFVRGFLREVVAVAQLDHPNIARTHKVGRDEERELHFIVMEWLQEETLAARIERSGPLEIDEATDIVIQCASGLAAAHAKEVFHGDIKPDNLVLEVSSRVRIMDFGLTRTISSEGSRAKVIGTPAYMAPERFEGRPLDARSDVYALGVTFYYALSGELPHSGANTVQIIHSILAGDPKPLTELLPDLPVEYENVIAKMIAKSPDKRYATALEVREALLALDRGEEPAEPVVCVRCRARNRRGRPFCHECGADLVATARAEELSAELMAAISTGRADAVVPLVERFLRLPPESPLAMSLLETIGDRPSEPAEEADSRREIRTAIREYLDLGQIALAVAAIREKALLTTLDAGSESIVISALRTMQEELTRTLLDLIEKAMEEGDFSFAFRHQDALQRVADEASEEVERIRAANVRLEEFRQKQRAAADPLIGCRMGHWVIEERLGEGAFGQVYRGLNVRLRQPVAIKILKREFVEDSKALALFRREARAAAKLDHPGIVRIFGLEFDERTANHFLVLEFVRGRNLQTVLRCREDLRLPLDFSLAAVRTCAEALAKAHEAGIVHRDIKPGNILVLPDGAFKVADFGLARHLDSDPTTTLKGTPPFMSPEQWESKEDHRTDIYALGVCLYHMLSGAFPYPGAGYQIAMRIMTSSPVPLDKILPDLPPEACEFTMRLIAKNPAERPQTMREVAEQGSDLASRLDLDLESVPDTHGSIFTWENTSLAAPDDATKTDPLT